MNIKSNESTIKTIGMIMPLVVAIVAIGVQWGAVTSRLDSFKLRLEKTDQKIEALVDSNASVREDVAEIKGILKK